jgi:hypothetical protein
MVTSVVIRILFNFYGRIILFLSWCCLFSLVGWTRSGRFLVLSRLLVFSVNCFCVSCLGFLLSALIFLLFAQAVCAGWTQPRSFFSVRHQSRSLPLFDRQERPTPWISTALGFTSRCANLSPWFSLSTPNFLIFVCPVFVGQQQGSSLREQR